MSNDEKLKIVVSSALKALFASGRITTPISSFDLLARVISSGPPSPGLFPGPDPPPKLRLTDLSRFEHVLDGLSQEWNEGKLVLSHDGETTVLDIQLGQTSRGQTNGASAAAHGKKRKRIVDEDADSATAVQEDEASSDAECRKPMPSTLDSLSKDMREVYSLLQRGTAKGRLIAEQVCAVAGSCAQ